MKVIDTLSFPTGATGTETLCMGIVAVEQDGELKFYGGQGDGINEEADIQKICDWGGAIHPPVFSNFFESASQKFKSNKE